MTAPLIIPHSEARRRLGNLDPAELGVHPIHTKGGRRYYYVRAIEVTLDTLAGLAPQSPEAQNDDDDDLAELKSQIAASGGP